VRRIATMAIGARIVGTKWLFQIVRFMRVLLTGWLQFVRYGRVTIVP
jgi:hypothetical protein